MVTANGLAQAIKNELKNQERPVTWLAKESGISYPKIQNRLRGDSDFTLGEIYQVCAVLGMDPIETASSALESMSMKQAA